MWAWILFMVLTNGLVTECMYYDAPSTQRNFVFTIDQYDAKVRPSNNTAVNISFSLVNIQELNVEEQKLSAVGWFTVTWRDERISWTVSTTNPMTSLHGMEGELWRPELVIQNGVDGMDLVVVKDLLYRVSPDGDVTWEPPSSLQAYCSLDLTYFPFDKHRCGITVSGWTLTDLEMPLSASRDTVNLGNYQENSQWKLDESTEVQKTLVTDTVNNETRTFSKITFYLSLTRHAHFVGLTVFLPLWLLSVLSVLTFWMPSESGEKANYCVVLLLAIVVFLQLAHTYIPASPGGTPILVVYISFVLLMSGMCVVCGVLVLVVYHHESDTAMNPVTISVVRFLQTITCNKPRKDSSITFVEEESTTSPKPEKTEMSSRTSLPNGHSWNPLGGRMQLPALDTQFRKNRIHPKSASSQRSALSSVSKTSAAVQTNCGVTWKTLANSLDRLFLIIYILLTLVMHFTFTIVLVVGS